MFFKKAFLWCTHFIKNNRVAKYMYVSSGLSALGIFLVYIFIIWFDIPPFWASASSSFLCGTMHFFLLKNFIFYGKAKTHKKATIQYIVYLTNGVFAVFMVAYLFVLLLNFFKLFIHWKIISIPVSKGISMLIMFVWNYNFHKHITYRIK